MPCIFKGAVSTYILIWVFLLFLLKYLPYNRQNVTF